ncbi:phosphoglycerate mutase (2,3-diphosphoglycerate-independent) [candidate division KSB3 bacterium]|uniref:2,3-bisphosphoglycerate-independent phosphoglycerate mutase n=1 Tax=candidate division KSB3 bacterium TaxID=2044937 RepID=A0A2G6E3C3_9BACT|nr:MAG: phosphoglycerate mutase (2,3-diphosphoglycerate-independent) [candidate division KSB3 bacterium]PIE29070.1 MAG: phosphoglycerate mutase (2,3-diphosphoglycerate-independent) [candidate division KSB3 bacterium]
MAKNKLLLMIMDGVGLRDSSEYNALENAETPNLDSYFKTCPMTKLTCHGRAVGLPDGVMGNSEVGHLNIGAGRVVMQDLVRIDSALENGSFEAIPEYQDLVKDVKEHGRSLHLIGLLSDAGVHSDMNHLKKVLMLLKKDGVSQVYVHAITDGRDTPPNSGLGYLRDIMEFMKAEGVGKLATIIGRYYCMDRDNRWERIEIAYDALTSGVGLHTKEPQTAVKEMYADHVTDEFLKPIVVDYDDGSHIFRDGDAVLAMNFRADRMREIAIALNDKDFDGFERKTVLTLHYSTMKKYRADFPYPVLFKEQRMDAIVGELISRHALTQLRIAETEKYAHVTYFFNGGEEQQFEGEERILVPSPKVATYDLQPEMSAPEVTEKLLEAIENDLYDVIVLNFANGDMVGHTGVYEAAVAALECIDTLIGRIVNAFTRQGGTVLITADHGNSEEMWDAKHNQPHTQHSLNPVPFVVITADKRSLTLREGGSLCDIAPTMLELLNIAQPKDMTGTSLIVTEP